LRLLGIFCLWKWVKPKRLTEIDEGKAAKIVLDIVDELEA
jgi:hypothetical protein